MHGKSVSPLAFRGNPQFMMWYQQFHSGVRAVSMALMKSQAFMAVETQISWAPIPFISGTARLGSSPAACWWVRVNSPRVRNPSASPSIFSNGYGSSPLAASSGLSLPSLLLSSAATNRLAAAWAFTCNPLAEWAYPVNPPCSLVHFMTGVVHVGHPLTFVPSDPG